jgi:Na+:H+ antiporter, NhaA family
MDELRHHPSLALANAGISLGAADVVDAAGAPVAIGVVLGLVGGKIAGITGAAWIAARARIARLPEGVGWMQLTGVAAVAGIGFTVSIFIASLAFDAERLARQAKVGILAASFIASVLGAILLRAAPSSPTPRD